MMQDSVGPRLAAAAVHVYTAFGSVAALRALECVDQVGSLIRVIGSE